MNKNIFLFPAACLLLMAGCTADEQPDAAGLVPISLTATMEDAASAGTRAGTALNNSFASGDAFYAYFPENVRVGSTATASNTTFSYNGSAWSPATQPFFNAGTTSATVHAYYGKSGGSSGTQVNNSTESFSVATDQSGDANYKASDLMYATATVQKTSPTASLTFAHRMSKILVTANIGAGVTNIQSVKIVGGYRTINISTPQSCTLGTTLSNPNSSTNITMWSGTSTSTVNCAALIPPQTISGNFLQIVTNAGTATYSLSSKQFETGKSYQLTITVNAAAIGTTVAITGWTGTGDVTVNPTVVNEVLFPGALSGKFTINSGNHKIQFSQGNLRATYNGSSWSWSFAENQWDYIGNAAGNTSVTSSSPFISENATVDLFGWVGASSTWTGAAQYGITSSTATIATNGYGNVATEALKNDWGTLPISNGGSTANSGWRTLTKDEWTYLFNTRSTTSGLRYAKATVNSVSGVIMLPDDWSTDYATLNSTNTGSAAFTTNSISSDDWSSKFASHGAVFLPAAGADYRNGSSVGNAGTYGGYWSSSPYTSDADGACGVFFNSLGLSLEGGGSRSNGYSVRLVRQVE